MKVGSIGVIFIFMLIIFIVVTGIIALTKTEFMIGSPEMAADTDWSENLRILMMTNTNFSPLAGIFGLGYYLHNCSLPIVRSARQPKKTKRDVFLGYFFVFISYILIGTLGYIGFIGVDFKDYFISNLGSPITAGQIDQNCLNMFAYTDISAFILRVAILLLIFSGYPLIHFFLYSAHLKLFFGDDCESIKLNRLAEVGIAGVIVLVCTLFALFYPNIGTLLSYVGAVCGFFIIYLLPVLVYVA